MTTPWTCSRRYAAGHPHGLLLGNGWDESRWPGHRAAHRPTRSSGPAPGRAIYLTRIDGHSALVSHALRRDDPRPRVGQPAGLPTAGSSATPTTSSATRWPTAPPTSSASRPPAQPAASWHGTGSPASTRTPHPTSVPSPRSPSCARPRRSAGSSPRSTGARPASSRRPAPSAYAASPATSTPTARSARAPLPCTAPYDDAHEQCGHGYLTPAQIADHVVDCTKAGLQAGFHCIGDAAMEAIADGFELAATKLGVDDPRRPPAPPRARRDALGRG